MACVKSLPDAVSPLPAPNTFGEGPCMRLAAGGAA
jgi:hypothetical protein